MQQFKKILCPVDFSDFSARALRYAGAFAQQNHAPLLVYHCIQTVPAAIYAGRKPQEWPAWNADVTTQLKSFIEPCKLYNVEVSTEIEQGDPAAGILQQAAKQDVDLIVMGTHGTSGYEALLMGSVTNKVLHKARVPVLVVCKPTRTILSGDPDEPLFIGKILCALDPADIRLPMLHRAIALARSNQASILFFTVKQTSDQENVLEDLKEILQPDRETLCKIEFGQTTGHPVEEILKAIKQQESDLVIMGHHRRTTMLLDNLGSVTLRVIPRSEAPVLVIRD